MSAFVVHSGQVLWRVITDLLVQSVGVGVAVSKKCGCKSVDDNWDGFNVQSVVQVGKWECVSASVRQCVIYVYRQVIGFFPSFWEVLLLARTTSLRIYKICTYKQDTLHLLLSYPRWNSLCLVVQALMCNHTINESHNLDDKLHEAFKLICNTQ